MFFDVTIDKMAQRVGALCGTTIDFVSGFLDMGLLNVGHC